jgi:hypothetical protein
MELDFNIDLFTYAFEKNADNVLWEMWKLQFPNMDKETFISFEDYKTNIMTRKHTEISYEDIEKEMDLVEKAFKNG